MRRVPIAGLIVLATMLTVLMSCASVTERHMYPETEPPPEDKVATLVVAPPFQLQTFDGEEVGKIRQDTVLIRMRPGRHSLRATSMDRPIEFTAQPGWFYFLRVISGYGVGWNVEEICEPRPVPPRVPYHVEIIGGPHPFVTDTGDSITFDIPAGRVHVDRGGSIDSYKYLAPRFVYFSPAGDHLAFATLKMEVHMVRDGVESEPHHRLHTLSGAWSPDGEHFAYPVYLWGEAVPESKTIFRNQKNAMTLYIWMDGEVIGPFDAITSKAPLFFDVDGNLVYGAQHRQIWYVVDGDERIEMVSEQATADVVNKIYSERSPAAASR